MTALAAAGLATVLLALVHAGVPLVRRRLAGMPEGVVSSVGGGVAASYVFLHLLPELARGNVEIAEVLGDRVEPTALLDLTLFAVALAGFLVLYGLDHLAARAGDTPGVFAVHLGAYAAYNVLITYSLPTQFEAGSAVAVAFCVAMGVHFFLSDRALAEHHGERFGRVGRPVLIAALVGGFVLAWLFAPTRTTVVGSMLAALAGFVLYNVFSDELPSERRVRFPAFAISVVLYGTLLAAIVAAGE